MKRVETTLDSVPAVEAGVHVTVRRAPTQAARTTVGVVTIHTEHPFEASEREAARQLRGRLGSRVSLWTSGELGTPTAAGLTVSSMMVASGEPWRVLGLLGPDTDLLDALTSTGSAVVGLLAGHHKQLAQVFASLMPAPGGRFTVAEFEQTSWGPRLADSSTWAGVALESTVEVGYAVLATCVLEHLEIGTDDHPLHHARGQFTTLA